MTTGDGNESGVVDLPVTSNGSKQVMIRSERGDTIEVEGYGRWRVARRSHPYFGPKLLLVSDDMEYDMNVLLTAPGPDQELRLWWPKRSKPGWRYAWTKGPEVRAELVDTKQYNICEYCGEPIKNAEHQRQAMFGLCKEPV